MDEICGDPTPGTWVGAASISNSGADGATGSIRIAESAIFRVAGIRSSLDLAGASVGPSSQVIAFRVLRFVARK